MVVVLTTKWKVREKTDMRWPDRDADFNFHSLEKRYTAELTDLPKGAMPNA